MNPRLSWLTTFVAVAEELHFGRAAQRLHLSISTVSRHVQALEEAVGRSLFRRSTRSVALTDAGRRLYGEISHAVATVDRGLRAVAETEARSIGVAYTGAAERDLLPWLVSNWDVHRHGPLRLVPMGSAFQATAIAEGSVDVGIQWEGPRGAGFEVTVLHREPLHVALTPGHRCAGREVIPVTDLAADVWLMAADSSDLSVRERFVDSCRSLGFTPRIRDAATGHVAQVSLVSAGHGVCLVPSVAMSNPALANVAFAQLHELEATLVAVTRPDPPSPVREVVRALQQRAGATSEAPAGRPG